MGGKYVWKLCPSKGGEGATPTGKIHLNYSFPIKMFTTELESEGCCEDCIGMQPIVAKNFDMYIFW